MDRIASIREDTSLVWHKSCYSSFTSRSKISRLEKCNDSVVACISTGIRNTDQSASSHSLRSSMQPIDWSLCMFCQNPSQTKLSAVTTFKMSQQILDASKYDQLLSVRLSSIHDLIASEGKYHCTCHKAFMRKTSKTAGSITKSDLAIQWLLEEMKNSANQGHILELSEVWNRYCELAEQAGIEIPQSFVSRRATFKEKLQSQLHLYDFVVMQNQAIGDRQTVLVPTNFRHVPVSKLLDETDDEFIMPVYKPGDNEFLELVHVALKIRSDILARPRANGLDISEDSVMACIPDSLYMFIRLVLGGQSVFDCDTGLEESSDQCSKSRVQNVTFSLAQDFVYNATGGKNWTPKHIGLASTLHQTTRSKELVQLFHNAGHTISYENVLQVDNTLAENTLKSMNMTTGAVIPSSLVSNRFVHFTCDNIDINDSSLDGKNSFHATQFAAWQRGPALDMGLQNLKPLKESTTRVPAIMEELIPAGTAGVTEPKSTSETQKEWFVASEFHNPEILKANAHDMAFFLTRNDRDNKIGWTNFNQKLSTVDAEVTTIGYMPIIQSPAHELDTLNTVVLRCKHVANALGQQHVILTVDEALYCKLMELKWANNLNFLVVRLGGLHTILAFFKVIGKHMNSSGRLEAWIESNVLGPKAGENVVSGKSYARGVRVHKLTLQAMWRILMPQLLDYIGGKSISLKEKILEKSAQENGLVELISILESQEFSNIIDGFVTSRKDDINFRYWWSYMQMVQILLLFIRAQREGLWSLHIHSFQHMLPLFMRYDHTNYARWGTIYLNEMHQLPAEVQQEFDSGNFVVKRSSLKFNQVDPDQSQEWLNGIGKKGGGIIGITKTSTALSRWALSYNIRSHIALETRALFGVNRMDDLVHNESTAGRIRLECQDEDRLYSMLASFGMLRQEEAQVQILHNIATKDVATEVIARDLVNASSDGLKQLNQFVEERLMPSGSKKFRDPLHKNKPKTFASLFEPIKTSKTNSTTSNK